MKKYILTLVIFLPQWIYGQNLTKYIVVDQFGYRPVSEKIAIIRNPVNGFDAAETFSPGNTFALVNVTDNSQVFTSSLTPWNEGNVDNSSGDQVWRFDFSNVETPGIYFILDIDNNLKSNDFIIEKNVYAEVLKHALRTFFYQRAGYEKSTAFAGQNWADEASHLGPLQDTQARRFDAKDDPSTERDLRGGWYDAGDYNKYTSWTSNYIIDLIKAYEENPLAWTDDNCLPYSENGVPDIVDEIKWGLDYLLRLQEGDGSLISVLSLSHDSPPSTATGQSLYGAVNTSATLAAAAAYAYGAKLYDNLDMSGFSNTLLQSAIAAWDWAEANPSVVWENNSAAYNSVGIGAGQQETDDYGRLAFKLRAAVHLYEITQEDSYKLFVENNYSEIHLILWNFAFPFEQENQETLLYYAQLPGASTEVVAAINNTFKTAMESTHNFMAISQDIDPYQAHLKDYVWGSNHTKCRKGLMFMNYVNYAINTSKEEEATRAAEKYIHYLHGVNPLNFCYLSNMRDFGAENGVMEFYHSWFEDNSDWDRAGSDRFGPAPGFLVGGPNPTYDWDGCCPSNCAGRTCDDVQRQRIKDQPNQKAYDDFNTNWPMNSWSVTENSGGYQVAYLRLLSTFVDASDVAASDCTMSNTITNLEIPQDNIIVKLFPNPTNRYLHVESKLTYEVKIFDTKGSLMISQSLGAGKKLDLIKFPEGTYVLQLIKDGNIAGQCKIIKTN